MNTETEDSAIYTDVKWCVDKIELSKDYNVRPLWIKSCKKKGTFLLESLFKQDDDRVWFYREFIPFVLEIAGKVDIEGDIIMPEHYVCVYVPAQLLYYIIEYYDFMEVNYIWDRFSSTDTMYTDEDKEWIKKEWGKNEDETN